MSKTIKIIIPELPPTDNHIYGQSGKRKFMYKQAKEWKELARHCAKQAYKGKVDSKNKDFDAEAWFYLKYDRDVHGTLKLLYDSFEGIIYKNDRQLFHQESWKVHDSESKLNPRVEIFIKRLND